MRELHPLRLQYALCSDESPLMAPVSAMAQQVRQNRKPAASDNPFLALQDIVSRQLVAGLDMWRDMRDSFGEWMFLSVYGSPLLQAAVGIDPADTRPMRRAGKSQLHRALVDSRISELKSRMAAGGMRAGMVRAMLYAGMPRGAVDERAVESLRRMHAASDSARKMTVAEFKTMVREQFFMLVIDQEAALAAIPGLLPKDSEARRKAFGTLREVLSAGGEISGEVADRLRQVAGLFGIEVARTKDAKVVRLRSVPKIEGTRAS